MPRYFRHERLKAGMGRRAALVAYLLCVPLCAQYAPHRYSSLSTVGWPQSLTAAGADVALARCYSGKTRPLLHPLSESASAVGPWWGAVTLTNWSEWAAVDPATGQIVYNFSACSPEGERRVSTLTRFRNESMETAFVPPLEYAIQTQDGAHVLAFARNMSAWDDPLATAENKWILKILPKAGLGGMHLHDLERAMFEPDLGFHETLVAQSMAPTNVSNLPIGKTRIVSVSGEILCAHPVYGLALVHEIDAAINCTWRFGGPEPGDNHQGFQSAVSNTILANKMFYELAVVHAADTFESGSTIAVMGFDYLGRAVHKAEQLFDRLTTTPTNTTGLVQLTGKIHTGANKSFSPPPVMRAAKRERVVYLRTWAPGDWDSAYPVWSQRGHALNCSGAAPPATEAANLSTPVQSRTEDRFYIRWTDPVPISSHTQFTNYTVSIALDHAASRRDTAAPGWGATVVFRMKPVLDAQITNHGIQTVVDMSTSNALRVTYDTRDQKVSMWVALPNTVTSCADTHLAPIIVYREGVETAVYPHSFCFSGLDEGWVQAGAPVNCAEPHGALGGIRICADSELGCVFETQSSLAGVSAQRRSLFEGTVKDAMAWRRLLALHEVHFWIANGQVHDPHTWSVLDWQHTLAHSPSTATSTDLERHAHLLDCRIELYTSATRIEWGNSYGSVRCVARSVHNQQKELDFVPMVHCHKEWCTDDKYPYRCTDGHCVGTPDGCHNRSINSVNNTIIHQPCPPLVHVMQRQDLSPASKSLLLQSTVTQLVDEALRNRTRMVFKVPDTLAYDNTQLQSMPIHDVQDPRPGKLFSIPASTSYALLANLRRNPYTTKQFRLATTQVSVGSSTTTTIDQGPSCHVTLDNFGAAVDKTGCSNGHEFQAGTGAGPKNCHGDRGGVRTCPSSRPHKCLAEDLLAYEWALAPHRIELCYPNSLPTGDAYTVSSLLVAAVGNPLLRFTTLRSQVWWASNQHTETDVVQITPVDSASLLWKTMMTSGHPDFGGFAVRADATHMSEWEAEPSVLYFALVNGTRVLWPRVVPSTVNDRNAFVYPDGSNLPNWPGTLVHCKDEESARVGSWALLLYNMDHTQSLLDQNGQGSVCGVNAWRIPTGMSVADSAPFPVYRDLPCVSSIAECAVYSGLAPCSNPLSTTFTPKAMVSAEAVCLQVTEPTHLTGLYAMHYASGQKLASLFEQSDGKLVWDVCDSESTWCVLGLADRSLGNDTVTLTNGHDEVVATGTRHALYSTDGSFALSRLSWPSFKPCDFADNNSVTCYPSCSGAHDVFAIKSVKQNVCLTYYQQAQHSASTAHPHLQWAPCDQADGANQTLRFRRLSFVNPNGIAQLEFTAFPGSCLYVHESTGPDNLLQQHLAVDYSCTQWTSVRFLIQGVVLDSQDSRFYTLVTMDTLFEADTQTRASTELECQLLVTSDAMHQLVRDRAGVPAGTNTPVPVEFFNPDVDWSAQSFSDGDGFSEIQTQGQAPLIGCSVQYVWGGGRKRVVVAYATEAGHTQQWTYSESSGLPPVAWTQNMGYGTEDTEAGVQPWDLSVGFVVSGDTKALQSQTFLSGHFEPVLCTGASCVSSAVTLPPVFRDQTARYGNSLSAYSAHRTPPSTDIKVAPFAGVIKSRNWDVVHAHYSNTSVATPSEGQLLWEPMLSSKGRVLTLRPGLSSSAQTRHYAGPHALTACQRMCELSATCEMIAWNSTVCTHTLQRSVSPVVRPQVSFQARVQNSTDPYKFSRQGTHGSSGGLLEAGELDAVTGFRKRTAPALILQPLGFLNKTATDHQNRSVVEFCKGTALQFFATVDTMSYSAQRPRYQLKLRTLAGNLSCTGDDLVASTVTPNQATQLACPNVSLDETYRVTAERLHERRMASYAVFKDCNSSTISNLTTAVQSQVLNTTTIPLVVNQMIPRLTAGYANKLAKVVPI